MNAHRWLVSPEVQTFLATTVSNMRVNSLDVERKGAEAKKWVSRKVNHVATVSRDILRARYDRRRLDQSQACRPQSATSTKLESALLVRLPGCGQGRALSRVDRSGCRRPDLARQLQAAQGWPQAATYFRTPLSTRAATQFSN